MDTLHTVLRAIRGETKSQRRDHLQIFREFLGNLDRIGRRSPAPPPPRANAAKGVNASTRHGASRSR
jgi:hypothetical protein